MPLTLTEALAEVRALLLCPDLVRAVAAGRRRGQDTPDRAELRPVVGRGGRLVQLVTTDGVRPTTRNLSADELPSAVDGLLARPHGNWHVETVDTVLQVRVTKRGLAQLHRAGRAAVAAVDTSHDRPRQHLLDPGDPLFDVIGGGAAKRRQVDAFLRALAATLPADGLPDPLRVVDLGCGNAYLTFAAHRYLTGRGHTVLVTGVEVREDQRDRNTALAQRLGVADQVRFVAASIADAVVDPAPQVALALHACDTATDEALARALGWRARWVLAAPCCHHDLASQLRALPATPLTRHGILRERLADTLTDAMRAALLRRAGYQVEVVDFIDSAHTPRNTLLRARRGPAADAGPEASAAAAAEYEELVAAWRVVPALAGLLAVSPPRA
ncbi:SAM-dependent methyltransferase [Pilimelia columellifera]|uniref:Methyltransferase domain-containing protein n=1 Tax=Pilimelia columellifera subsp. columellifera TaxID=706583 RepID=A0ABN3NEU6_9ACTN